MNAPDYHVMVLRGETAAQGMAAGMARGVAGLPGGNFWTLRINGHTHNLPLRNIRFVAVAPDGSFRLHLATGDVTGPIGSHVRRFERGSWSALAAAGLRIVREPADVSYESGVIHDPGSLY